MGVDRSVTATLTQVATLNVSRAVTGSGRILGPGIDCSSDCSQTFATDGNAWTQLHSLSAESRVTGDLDGNGIDEVIIDFGSVYGIWVNLNGASWFQLHKFSPSQTVTADVDGNGRDEIIIDFPGVWDLHMGEHCRLRTAPPAQLNAHVGREPR